MPGYESPGDGSPYREVRGLSRGLAVLRALNAMPGGIGSVADVARATSLHRTTVKRLLETLMAEGLVHHSHRTRHAARHRHDAHHSRRDRRWHASADAVSPRDRHRLTVAGMARPPNTGFPTR